MKLMISNVSFRAASFEQRILTLSQKEIACVERPFGRWNSDLGKDMEMIATINTLEKPPLRSNTASNEVLTTRQAVAIPGHQPIGIIVCPKCYKKLRCHNKWPGRAICPKCGFHVVVLRKNSRLFSACAEDEDSVDEMIYEWLDDEEEDNSGEDV
jgi:hypothetical protein